MKTGTQRPTLGRLLDDLGPGLVSLLAAPHGVDVEVTEAAIHDPAFASPIESGDLLLAVGTPPERGIELVQLAGAQGAAGVAFRLSDEAPRGLVDAAEGSGVALLGLPPEASWTQFHALVRTALARVTDRPSEDVPVGDLFALANAVAAMVGGAVTIEDPSFRVIAYSSLDDQPVDELRMQTVLGRRSPAEWMERFGEAGFLDRVLRSDDVVTVGGIPEEGVLPRVALRVRAGEETLGSLWVIADHGMVPAESLREASRMAALHLLRHRTTDHLDRSFRGDLLRSLLDGRGSAETVASQLGVPSDGAFAVVVFELHGSGADEAAIQRERARDLIAVYSEAFRRRAACVARGRAVYTLLPASDLSRERAIEVASDMRRRIEASLGIALRAGIGSVVSPIREVPRSRREADQVVRVLAASADRGPVAHIDDVRAHALLLELQDLAANRPALRRGKLERLVRSDAEDGTPYVDTLRAYFDCGQNAVEAARRLDIHPNTFRYRMGRLTTLAGLDLDDPDERLVTALQLRLL